MLELRLDAELTLADIADICDQAIALAEPLTDMDRKALRDAIEAEVARMIADQARRRGQVC